ncbi:epsin-1 [Chanos chanos]|uniref:Epsin-1 n=1 Tax=Chanos chanos TaxID=29144 RepID=A0A6J2WMA8_CHACN|nr:epsin-1-like [Chanos chanos]
MTHSMLRRQLKNLVQNFSEAEVKVREATSNDPWGPSSSQMADISDLTYNVVACNEIMAMLWKRLNDDKNWRHVYKSLTLLEYLLKTGSDRIPQQCQENIHVVKALTEYRFTDKDGKDQGVNVREKAKIVLVLIQDEDKRKEERDFAMKTKDKLTKASADPASEKDKPVIPPYTGLPSLDNIPSVADLTAAMAAKKEEQRRLEAKRKEEERKAKEGDTEPDLWEQAATAAPPSDSDPWGAPSTEPKESGPATNDPWGGSKDPAPASNDPWGGSADAPKESSPAANDPWGGPSDAPSGSTPVTNDPWGAGDEASPGSAPAKSDPWGANAADDSAPANDPWGAPSEAPAAKSDPWGGDGSATAMSPSDPFGDSAKADDDPWGSGAVSPPSSTDPWGAPAALTDGATTDDPFGDGNKSSSDPWGAPAENTTNGDTTSTEPINETGSKKPPSFLGEAASLVDLDSLMSSKPKAKQPPLNAMPTSSQKAAMPPQGTARPPGCTMSSPGVSMTFPSTSNSFGFTPMAPSTLYLSLRTPNPSLAAPFSQLTPPPQTPSLSGLPMPAMGFPLVPRSTGAGMVQPGAMGNPIGGVFGASPIAAGSGVPLQPQSHPPEPPTPPTLTPSTQTSDPIHLNPIMPPAPSAHVSCSSAENKKSRGGCTSFSEINPDD